jgi:4-hydroxybenzoate polyprenyltransferase
LRAKDPDELTSNGIGSIFMGDGFFMVAVILSATHTAVSSLLWLFLLIPAFFFFGKGFADVLYARQIRRNSERKELNSQEAKAFLPRSSSEGLAVASVTERTTRNLG